MYTINIYVFVESVQFSRSVMSNSLWPHELQHAKLPCPLPTPGACSNSGPLSQWCHPTISSSVIPSSSCLQSFSALWSFLMSQFFTSGGKSNGASASVLPMNIQDWFPLGLTGWISLQPKGLSSILQHPVQKHQFFSTQLSLWSSSHIHTWLLEKPYLWLWTFVGKVMSLLLNINFMTAITICSDLWNYITKFIQSFPYFGSFRLFPYICYLWR